MYKILIILFSFSALAFIPDSFRMNYIQEFKSQVSQKNRRATGVFEYKYPSNLKVDQDQPEKLTYVSNSKTTWIFRAPLFDDEPAEVTVHKGQEASLSNFFDILKDGLKTNGNYSVVLTDAEALLTFNKSAAKSTGIKTAMLKFSNKKNLSFEGLSGIDISYLDGRMVELKLSNIATKVKFPKKHFVFDIPKGAKVLKQ